MNEKWQKLGELLADKPYTDKLRWGRNPLPLLRGEAKALLSAAGLNPTTSNVEALVKVLPLIKQSETVFTSAPVSENLKQKAATTIFTLLIKRSQHLSNAEKYFNDTLKLWLKTEPEQTQKNIIKIFTGTKKELHNISLPAFIYFLATWKYDEDYYVTEISNQFYSKENNK